METPEPDVTEHSTMCLVAFIHINTQPGPPSANLTSTIIFLGETTSADPNIQFSWHLLPSPKIKNLPSYL